MGCFPNCADGSGEFESLVGRTVELLVRFCLGGVPFFKPLCSARRFSPFFSLASGTPNS